MSFRIIGNSLVLHEEQTFVAGLVKMANDVITSPLMIFDLDGVLLDSKTVHFEALNEALRSVDPRYLISPEDHSKTYDGLSTQKKLELLHNEKGLPKSTFSRIWEQKQSITQTLLSGLKPDLILIEHLKFLKDEGALICLASNSIKETVDTVLRNLGIYEQFDLILSNADVRNPKPHPEIYWKCMAEFSTFPNATTVFEDSPVGKKAAILSGANLMPVANRADLTFEKIKQGLEMVTKGKKLETPWHSDEMNVLVPMAGAGSRFTAAGYTFPKPLVEVEGKPMIQAVVENINIHANFIFIVQQEHFEKYNLGILLNLIAPNCKIVKVNGLTEGAACTTLLAKELINNSNPLLIANSDQVISWNSSETIYGFESKNLDGGIVTFESTHPKWSYAKVGEDGYVTEVAEKKPISRIATAGIYYWRKGEDYVKYAEKMIEKNIRTNGEFYVCPVFNEAIEDGLKIQIKNVEKMWGIGTPEDLDVYLKR